MWGTLQRQVHVLVRAARHCVSCAAASGSDGPAGVRLPFNWGVIIALLAILAAVEPDRDDLFGDRTMSAARDPARLAWRARSRSRHRHAAVRHFLHRVEHFRARLDAATLALRTKERDEAEARRLATEAQLASLESRVNPHFLFNTLNSIAALVRDDPGRRRADDRPARGADALVALPAVETARHARRGAAQSSRAYLEIERVRFGDRLHYRFDVEEAARTRSCRGWRCRRSPRTASNTRCRRAARPTPSRFARRVTNGRLRLEVADDGPGFRRRGSCRRPRPRAARVAPGDDARRSRAPRVDGRPGDTVVTICTVGPSVSRSRLLRAYVVDDERLAVQRLTRLLEATGRVEIVGSTTDPEAALAFLRRTPSTCCSSTSRCRS